MARILLGISTALLATLLAAYLLIPGSIVFSKIVFLRSTISGAERAFYDKSERLKWWPQQISTAGKSDMGGVHSFENYAYEFPDKTYSGSAVNINRNDKTIISTIHFVRLRADSIAIKWMSELPETKNPFKRIANYLEAVAIKKNMASVLETVKNFLSKEENLYGIKIVQEKVKDTILMSTRWTTGTYPSTEMIYEKINDLKKYIALNNGVETNHPMLNIVESNGEFNSMVAIPLNKELPEKEAFVIKKMIPGKILTAEVNGGTTRPLAALKKIELFIEDHKLSSPAIPFESLVTDRTKEKDSTKWVTKVYYPIY